MTKEWRPVYPYMLATPEQKKLGSLWWCIHHGIKLEPLSEPIERRADYILHAKAEHERETRLRAMRPVLGTLPPALTKAYADWQKAYADWQKADADWQKAYADRQKADADWQKADADRQKAYADRQKAYADRQKADADRQKANADRQKADAEHAAEIDALFSVECADVAWGPDGLIFPEVGRDDAAPATR
jgi:hypothetical protein